jgi:hypothetical protein
MENNIQKIREEIAVQAMLGKDTSKLEKQLKKLEKEAS